jgi:hypothetical protein
LERVGGRWVFFFIPTVWPGIPFPPAFFPHCLWDGCEIEILIPYSRFKNPSELSDLVRVVPEGGDGRGSFSITLDSRDPRIRELLKVIATQGRVPNQPTDQLTVDPETQRLRYVLGYELAYEAADFEQAEYFFILPDASLIGDCEDTEDGGLLFEPSDCSGVTVRNLLAGKIPLLQADFGRCIVSDAFQQTCTAAGLQAVAFERRFKFGRKLQRRNVEPKYSLLTSNVTITDHDYLPTSELPGASLLIEHGAPDQVQDIGVRLSRRNLGTIEPFDVARLLLGRSDDKNLAHIYSRKFKAMCAKEKVKTDWSPVIVDP